MGGRATTTKFHTVLVPAPEASLPSGVLAPLRTLISVVDGAYADGGQADGQEREVLSVELDGYRCVLTRLKPDRSETAAVMALSPREREIARMVAQGLTNKTIAGVLDISPWTVATYLRRIFSKFNVNSRAAMVAHFLNGDWRNDT